MNPTSYTCRRRDFDAPKGHEYGAAWRCPGCGHTCWTRITKRDYDWFQKDRTDAKA